MAIISKINMTNLAELLGNSYQNIVNSYGNVDTLDTVVFEASRAKSYVRGGTDAKNGIRASRISSGGTILDLLPSCDPTNSTEIYIERGKFYINGKQKELMNNVVIDTDPLLDNPAGYGLYTGEQKESSGSPLSIAIDIESFIKGLIYLTEDPINDDFDIDDWASINNAFIINDIPQGTGTWSIAQAMSATQDGITVDEIHLFLAKIGSPVCNLQINIYEDNGSGAPDITSGSLGNSVSISSNELLESGSWISFPLTQRIDLNDSTNTIDFWIVLSTSSLEDELIINNNNYIIWRGDSTKTISPTSAFTFSNYRSAITGSGQWTGLGSTNSAAHRVINYVRGIWTYFPGFVGFQRFNMENWVTLALPENAHACVAEIVLKTNGTGTILSIDDQDSENVSFLNDIRAIIGYQGLEDDDQMGDLFDPINASEDSILSVSAETRSSVGVAHYKDIIIAINEHISSHSKQEVKAYWKEAGINFTRAFRKLWYLSQKNIELSTIFGIKGNTGELKTFTDATNNWKYKNTYCANVTVGCDLELIIPKGNISWEEADILDIYAIRAVWTTLADNININDELIKLKELPATFLSAAQAGPVYIWVEKWGEKNGELLYIDEFVGKEYTSGFLATTDATDGPAMLEHKTGDRVYLVDKLEITIEDALSETTAQSISSEVKYIGCAYINSSSAIEGKIAIRSV